MTDSDSRTPSPGADAESGGRRRDLATLFLAGDVMTGRGIDQVLPHPGNPRLYEPYVQSAQDYVALAEAANGPIPAPVPFSYVWGDALDELRRRQPDVRIVNLETAVTQAELPAPKGINYRMNPANMPVLTAAEIDCCTLANNHLLDWGDAGLIDTLEALDRAGIARSGAGADLAEAVVPASHSLPGGGRVLTFSCGHVTSGIPRSWAAMENRAGINLLPDLSPQTVRRIAAAVGSVKRPGDLVVLSVHWGSNWGYQVASEELAFARALIDEAQVDIVHGHSSHHPKAVEVYRGKPILYGCGDFLNDYEGITGYEAFRDDLVLAYLPEINVSTRRLERFDIVPYRIRNFRLNRAAAPDAAWLQTRFNELGRRFGTRARLAPDGSLTVEWD